jgi:hypothetical protein
MNPVKMSSDYSFDGPVSIDEGVIYSTTSMPRWLGLNGDTIRINTTRTPTNASGLAGEMCWDADYLYVCVATDTWKKVALSNL